MRFESVETFRYEPLQTEYLSGRSYYVLPHIARKGRGPYHPYLDTYEYNIEYRGQTVTYIDHLKSEEAPMREPVLAHERGHADSFFENALPEFKKLVKDKRPRSEVEKNEVKFLFAKVRNDAAQSSVAKANKNEDDWYLQNNFSRRERTLVEDKNGKTLKRKWYEYYKQ